MQYTTRLLTVVSLIGSLLLPVVARADYKTLPNGDTDCSYQTVDLGKTSNSIVDYKFLFEVGDFGDDEDITTAYIQVYVAKVGTPVDTLDFTLYRLTADKLAEGSLGNSLLDTLQATPNDNRVTLALNTEIQLTTGPSYYFTISRSGTLSDTNYYKLWVIQGDKDLCKTSDGQSYADSTITNACVPTWAANQELYTDCSTGQTAHGLILWLPNLDLPNIHIAQPTNGQTFTTTATVVVGGSCLESGDAPFPVYPGMIIEAVDSNGIERNKAIVCENGSFSGTLNLYNDTWTIQAFQNTEQGLAVSDVIPVITMNFAGNPMPNPITESYPPSATYSKLTQFFDSFLIPLKDWSGSFQDRFSDSEAQAAGLAAADSVNTVFGYSQGLDSLFGGIPVSLILTLILAFFVIFSIVRLIKIVRAR